MKKYDFWRLVLHSLGMALILATAMAIALAVTALLGGCRGAEKVVYQTRHDSIYIARTDTFVREVLVATTDTIRLHDSIFLERINTITLNEKGDTIYRDRIVFRDRWHDAAQTSASNTESNTASNASAVSAKSASDTIYINKVVEQKPTLAQRAQSAGGWVAFFVLLIAGAVVYMRK